MVEAGEACDDGAETAACNANCGDSVVNVANHEACDEGGETESCNADCTVAVCGDGIVNATRGEACDDGNTNDGDSCSADCSEAPATALCGDIPTDRKLTSAESPVGWDTRFISALFLI